MPIDWSSITGCIDPTTQEVTLKCFEAVFQNIIIAVSAFAGIVFLLILLAGGFKYLTAAGDPKKVEQAKGTITAGFAGVLLIAAAFVILVLIENFTGVNVTDFIIPTQ